MKNVLGPNVLFLDWTTIGATAYILYKDTIPGTGKLILYNNATKAKEYFEQPKQEYWEGLIDTLTDKKLAVNFTLNRDGDSLMKIVFNRPAH